MSKPSVLAVVPARGGSKSIPRKNIRKLAGKPLLAYTAEAGLASRNIDRFILSTDDEEIAEVGRKYGLEVPFLRPAELATDNAPTLPVIQHAVNKLEAIDEYRPDYIVVLQPTSPLRKACHIDSAMEKLIGSDADSIISVTEVPHACNPYSVMRLNGEYIESFLDFDELCNLRQKKPVFYARNGAAIYAFTRECLLKKNSLYGDKVLPYFMKKEESIDIDDLWDWKLVELIMEYGLYEE